MIRRILVALAGAWLTAGLAGAQPPSNAAADPAIWQGEAGSGPILHRASNVSLPERIEGFRRTRVTALGPDDVAAHYEWRDGRTAAQVTLYLFRPGALPEHGLRGSLAAFAAISPSAFIWSQGPFDIAAPRPLHAYKGTFKTGIGPDTIMDYLYFVRLGGWTVKVRATLTGITGMESEERLDALVRALPWTEILAANGACSGAACSAPDFEPIESHYMQMMLPTALAAGMRFDPDREAGLPVAARAEIPLAGNAEIRRSDGAPLLYVTSVPNFATYRLVRIPDPANRLLTDGFGRISVTRPVYGLFMRMGGEDLMPRMFHGEPTPEAFGRAVAGLVIDELPGPMVPVARAARETPEEPR